MCEIGTPHKSNRIGNVRSEFDRDQNHIDESCNWPDSPAHEESQHYFLFDCKL